jgi:hypothetical protein
LPGIIMSESAEALLKRQICVQSGLPAEALGDDDGLFSAGVDEDDLQEAFVESCMALGVDPGLIQSEALARPNSWLLTSLGHLGPFWPAADLARRDLEASVRVPAEPTIRSLAETIRLGCVVSAGPDVPVPPAPALTATRVSLRAASVSLLTLYAGPGIGFLTCKPVCHVCPGSLSEAVIGAFLTSLAVLVVIGAAILLPGLLHLMQNVRPLVAE